MFSQFASKTNRYSAVLLFPKRINASISPNARRSSADIYVSSRINNCIDISKIFPFSATTFRYFSGETVKKSDKAEPKTSKLESKATGKDDLRKAKEVEKKKVIEKKPAEFDENCWAKELLGRGGEELIKTPPLPFVMWSNELLNSPSEKVVILGEKLLNLTKIEFQQYLKFLQVNISFYSHNPSFIMHTYFLPP
jgi:hypothetical protein